VVINGTQVLNSISPRSYRATRLVWNNGWSFNSSNGYDVYGDVVQANNMLAYLQTFSQNDILILNTWDEPNNNRTVFRDELVNSFKAGLQYSSVWAFRCSYQLIASKGKGVIYESIMPSYSYKGIQTTLIMG
jgi:hypothetical protein